MKNPAAGTPNSNRDARTAVHAGPLIPHRDDGAEAPERYAADPSLRSKIRAPCNAIERGIRYVQIGDPNSLWRRRARVIVSDSLAGIGRRVRVEPRIDAPENPGSATQTPPRIPSNMRDRNGSGSSPRSLGSASVGADCVSRREAVVRSSRASAPRFRPTERIVSGSPVSTRSGSNAPRAALDPRRRHAPHPIQIEARA